jgi:alpha-beta hydrolase superfamily lysophospholipase
MVMKMETFTFRDPQDYEIFVYKWLPENGRQIKAAVQIAHGMAETAARYERFAKALTEAGYMVYANDHRGHGRTTKDPAKVGFMGTDGLNWAVKDMQQLHQVIQNENPTLPIFLLGHSMGSFLTQQYISLYGAGLQGAILSGTSGKQGFILNAGALLAKLVMLLKGAQTPSPFLDQLTFGGYNNHLKPNRTKFDWLSRDEVEVDRYIADPFCGTVFSAGYFYDLCRFLKQIHRLDTQRQIPVNLPIYLFAGSMDPVGNLTKTIRQLIRTYQTLEIHDVNGKFYPDGRHEMLNETNRDEVTRDVIQWLDGHLKTG